MPSKPISVDDKRKAREAVEKHGGVNAAAKALGLPRTTLQNRIKDSPRADRKAGKTLEDFRSRHDKDYIVPKKIKAALEQLGDSWEYESDFIRLAGLSQTDFASYRDQFDAHAVVVDRSGKRVWTGTKSMAEKLRGMVR